MINIEKLKKGFILTMSLLVFSSILFVFMAKPDQSNLSTSEIFPQTSSLIDLPDVVIIDNNWSATVAMYDWCTGSGTEGDPYIIQGINITGGAGGAALTILDSAEHFIIKNSSFSDVVMVYGHYIFAGIYIDKAEFGLIENCTIANSYYGITINEAENMRIINNTFIGSHNNPQTGMGPAIYIEEAKNVNISYNYIKDYYVGVMVYDSEESTIDNNHIENLLFGHTSDAGVYFYHTNDSAITNNDFYGCESSETPSVSGLSTAGVSDSVNVDPSCINILVRGNRFFDLNGNLIVGELGIPSFSLPIVIGLLMAIMVAGALRIKRRIK